jgi:sugar lactone lactonase YvrE
VNVRSTLGTADGSDHAQARAQSRSPLAPPLHSPCIMNRFVVVALTAACSSSQPVTPVATPVTPAPTQGSAARRDIPLPGDANGIYWDASDHTLYLTDVTHDALIAWTDANGFATIAELPPASKVELGGLTRLADGTFVIASFGFGSDGAVLAVGPDHHATAIAGLDKARRRIGITRAPDGTLYDAYFVVDGHQHTGGVAKLDLATGESDVVTQGLAKAVGVAATAAGVFVSDQESNTIYAIDKGALKPLASGLPSVDLLTALPDGSLVTGGKTGAVVRIAPDGTHSEIASGFEQVRGTAYDPAGHRLFVVEHGKAGANHTLHVLPL